MSDNICPSCGYYRDCPSGDAHNNKPWEMLVTNVADNEEGLTTITFELDKEAHKAMANLGVQFVLHCAAAQVDMQVALDAIFRMGEAET
jgi:hypothetical protein